MVNKGKGYYTIDKSDMPDFSESKVTVVLINEVVGKEIYRETYYNIEAYEALSKFAKENPCIDKGDTIRII